ncbi:MAG: MFS transporter [Tistlia sp.]|uniref:MFS transporter n=1 Tax=Tistlia sp. TaxID=3057121 RepID=UPI0034A33B37
MSSTGQADPGRPGALRTGAMLASLAFGRLCMGMQLQAIASLTPFLMADLGFDYSQIGLLIGLFLAPGVVLGLLGSLIGARLGYRRLGLFGALLMAAGSLWLGFVEGFWAAAGARLVAGTGGILVNIACLRLATELFEGKAMNRAIAVTMSAWPVGIGLAAVTFAPLAVWSDWRLPLWLLTGVTLLSALWLAFSVGEPARPARPRAPLFTLTLDRRSGLLALLLGAAFACFTAAGVIYLSFAPPFFIEAGMSLTEANATASMIFWLGLLGTPLGGWLADRRGGTPRVLYLGILGAALLVVLVVALIAEPLAPLALTVLLGIVWGLPAAPFTGLLQRMLPLQAHGAGYGVYFTLFYCGFFAFPALAGRLTDATGSPGASLWFACALLLATALLVAAFYRAAHRPASAASA